MTDETEVATCDDLVQIVQDKLVRVFTIHSWELEGMWSRALTYLASVLDHMDLIQIRFSPLATVSRIPEKKVYLFR